MKVIRIWGLLAFVVITILITLFWLLAAPSIVKQSIETLGSEAVGAQVNVEQVDLSLLPLALQLNQLQVADAEKPMRNLLQADQVKMSLDSEALAWRKLHIEALTLSGVRINTPRQTSGALQGGRRTTQAMRQLTSISLPELTEQDMANWVDQADLITLKRIEKFKQQQQAIRSQWQQALDKKALAARIDTIKQEFERLSARAKANKLNLIKDAKDWKKLRQTIKEERNRLKQLKQQLKADQVALKQSWQQVKAGPQDDVQAILNKVGLPGGDGGVVQQLLTEQFAPYIQRLGQTFSGGKVVAEDDAAAENQSSSRQLGKRIEFADRDTRPEFLIKTINIDGEDGPVTLSGKGRNWGYKPWRVGAPAELDIQLNHGAGGQGQIHLQLHAPSEDALQANIDGQLTGWTITDFPLMQSAEQQWILQSATMDATLQGHVTPKNISLELAVDIRNPQLQHIESLQGWQGIFAKSVNQQSTIAIKVNASGDPAAPKIRVKSSLEALLKDAMGQKIKEKVAQYKTQIADKINAKVGDLSALQNFSGDFASWQQQLGQNDQLLQDLLGKIKR